MQLLLLPYVFMIAHHLHRFNPTIYVRVYNHFTPCGNMTLNARGGTQDREAASVTDCHSSTLCLFTFTYLCCTQWPRPPHQDNSPHLPISLVHYKYSCSTHIHYQIVLCCSQARLSHKSSTVTRERLCLFLTNFSCLLLRKSACLLFLIFASCGSDVFCLLPIVTAALNDCFLGSNVICLLPTSLSAPFSYFCSR